MGRYNQAVASASPDLCAPLGQMQIRMFCNLWWLMRPCATPFLTTRDKATIISKAAHSRLVRFSRRSDFATPALATVNQPAVK